MQLKPFAKNRTRLAYSVEHQAQTQLDFEPHRERPTFLVMTVTRKNQDQLSLDAVVKHSTADPGIASSIPLTPTKITKKGDMYWFFPGKMRPCISA